MAVVCHADDGYRVLNVLFCIKFHQNRMIFFVDICRFNDFQDGGRRYILNFRNLEFMLCDLYRRAILLPCTKLTRLLRYGQKTFLMVAVRVQHLKL